MPKSDLDPPDQAILLIVQAAVEVGLPGVPMNQLAEAAERLDIESINQDSVDKLAEQVRSKEGCLKLLQQLGLLPVVPA